MTYPQVVRIFCTYQDPDYDSPWQSLSPRGSSGSGVVIGKRTILTGAHVVANSTFLQVQKIHDPEKGVARVLAISHDSDLALLEVEDPRFLAGIRPARLGQLPQLRDQVAVVGYPVGGEEVSVTEGVVSRMEVQRYEHSQRYLLAVTVDAAINAGNSGGPVFADDRVVGIAFQAMPDAENVGEMVPAPLIRRFLDAVRTGKDTEVPGFGLSTQVLENPALRRHLCMKRTDSGVLIVGVQYGTTADGLLRRGDVLVEVDGMRIANNGTVQFQDRFRCQYDVVVGQHFVGDRLPVTVLRDGKRRRLVLPMRRMANLVARHSFGVQPGYLLFGGLLFQRLTADYLGVFGDAWWDKAPKELLYHYYHGERTAERQEVVVLSHVLSDAVNVGYEHLVHDTVVEVNDTKPRHLQEFVAMVDAAKGRVQIRTGSGGMILLEAGPAREALPRILARYHVPADRSSDLK